MPMAGALAPIIIGGISAAASVAGTVASMTRDQPEPPGQPITGPQPLPQLDIPPPQSLSPLSPQGGMGAPPAPQNVVMPNLF